MFIQRTLLLLIACLSLSSCIGISQTTTAPTPQPVASTPTNPPPAPTSDSDSQNTQLTTPTTSQLTPLPQTPTPNVAAICTTLPRPAALFATEWGDVLAHPVSAPLNDPATTPSCLLQVDPPLTAVLATIDTGLYYVTAVSPDNPASYQPIFLANDMTTTPLPIDDFDVFYFTARPDGSQIAWSRLRSGETEEEVISELYLADGNGRNARVVHTLSSLTDEGYVNILEPVAFDGEDLLFAVQPNGKGGAWNSYTGQRSNLLRLSLVNGDISPVVACPEDDYTECVNQVDTDRGVITWTNPAAARVSLRGLDGTQLASYPSPAVGYVGRPVINGRGDIAFIAANLADDAITIEEGFLQLIPGESAAPADTLLFAPITMLWDWIGNDVLLFTTDRTQFPDDPYFTLVDVTGNIHFLPKTYISLAGVLD